VQGVVCPVEMSGGRIMLVTVPGGLRNPGEATDDALEIVSPGVGRFPAPGALEPRGNETRPFPFSGGSTLTWSRFSGWAGAKVRHCIVAVAAPAAHLTPIRRGPLK